MSIAIRCCSAEDLFKALVNNLEFRWKTMTAVPLPHPVSSNAGALHPFGEAQAGQKAGKV
ncbi:hypothetical protein BJF95_10255 [Rhizobium oryziradicis]|uniref:Uncharacterized protein n=1 Tax=Rhizobium oryziradicis TaxID=1867956 RepID=A0A1Q8ZU26_9HYPH|nr:hypothetical protein BJF95_10255 [Rhizobium oryziradicis]